MSARAQRWRFRTWSLRLKLITLLVVASLVPLAIGCYLDVRAARTQARAAAVALLAARADEVVGRIDMLNRGRRRGVDRLSRDPEIISASAGEASALASTRAQFDGWAAHDPGILGVVLLDRAGVVRLATEPGFVGLDLSRHPYVGEALAGADAISDVHVAEPLRVTEPTVAYASPVTDGGQITGVVVAFSRAEGLWEILTQADAHAGADSFAELLDHDGVRIGHSASRAQLFRPAGELDVAVIDGLVHQRLFGDATRELLHDVRAFPAQFELARAAVPELASFTGADPLTHAPTLGVGRRLETTPWTVFFMLPEAGLQATVALRTRGTELLGGGLIVIALLAGLAMARVIARPIQALATATKALSRGDRAARVDVRAHASGDEIGLLAASFNAMAGQLQTAHDELEARVAQRTAELAQSHEQLAITLRSIGDGVIATDAACRITRLNPAAEQLTGWTFAAAEGHLVGDVVRLHDEATGVTIENPADRVLRGGPVVGLAPHTVLTARDGAMHAIADSGAPIRDDAGVTQGAVLVFRDVTGQREADRLRLHSREVEAERRQQREANRLKSEFLANMSHELRTPLNAIIGFTDLMHSGLGGAVTEDQQAYLGDILVSARHLLQLINDVLDLAGIESGNIQIAVARVDPRYLVTEVRERVQDDVLARHLRLGLDLDPALGDVVIDPARIKQVLHNFLSNAIKFTPDGGSIMVRIGPAAHASEFRIDVVDTGIGIAAENLPRLFVEFEQLDASPAKHYQGTGLGLVLCKRIVEAHGGRVEVQSTLALGSTFSAILPRLSRST